MNVTVHHECTVKYCTSLAVFKVENIGTGKVWVMCERHTTGYSKGSTMIVTERLDTN